MSINKMYIINLFIKVIIVFLNRSGLNLYKPLNILLYLLIVFEEMIFVFIFKDEKENLVKYFPVFWLIYLISLLNPISLEGVSFIVLILFWGKLFLNNKEEIWFFINSAVLKIKKSQRKKAIKTFLYKHRKQSLWKIVW